MSRCLSPPGALTGSGAASGPEEGLRTRLDAWPPAQSISYSTSRRWSMMICYDDLDGYRSRLDQTLQLTRKETAERVKQVLKGKIYAAEQSAPGSVNRSRLQ